MNESKICPNCGVAVPPEAPQGLCPKCVLADAAAPTQKSTGNAPREIPDLEKVKAVFPHLEVIEFLGAGGMGAVFKARQPKLDRMVAVKVLPESLAAQAGFAERFEREARLLARLNHPNIVGVFDFGQAGALFYLVMEFVDGLTLRQAMQAGRFSPASALALVPQICDALQYAHGEGILHRDVKPENILLDSKGRVKIADFGIAKLLQEKEPSTVLTERGIALGTPHYMAPEQLETPNAVDQRADIYSLGVVFYELLTGELPIGRFALPSEKAPVDPRVDPIVLKALEKEKERRFCNASEVKTRVQQLTTAPPPITAPPATSQRPGTARGATLSMVLTLVSLVPGVILVLASWFTLAVQNSGGGSSPRPVPSMGVLLLLPVLFMFLLAVPGFALGLAGLLQVRRSAGELRGATRALVGAMTWPVLIALAFASFITASALGGFVPNMPGYALRLLAGTGVPLLLGAALVTCVARYVGKGRAQGGATAGLVFTVAAAVLLLPALGCAFLSGSWVGTRAIRLATSARGPAQITSSISAMENGTAVSPDRGRLQVSLGISPAYGVIGELILNDRHGIRALPGSEVYLLANPDSGASQVVTWSPLGGASSNGSMEYQVALGSVNERSGSTNRVAFTVPPAAAKLVSNFTSNAQLGWLDPEEPYIVWFLQRNGPEPGVGARFRFFQHPLRADEISNSGYWGFGTNWLHEVQQ